MEKLNFVKNGVLRLPPGFRFHPTDEELVVQYLKRKVFSCPLPASIIPEVDVCKYDPWDLPGWFTCTQFIKTFAAPILSFIFWKRGGGLQLCKFYKTFNQSQNILSSVLIYDKSTEAYDCKINALQPL